MIVRLTEQSATVEEADDCKRLHVATALTEAGLVAKALRDTGTGSLAEDGSALLDVAVLYERAQASATAPDWDVQWQAMIEYVGRKGWLTEDGRSVQAHIEV